MRKRGCRIAAIKEQIVKFRPQSIFCRPFASGLTTKEWGSGIPQLQQEPSGINKKFLFAKLILPFQGGKYLEYTFVSAGGIYCLTELKLSLSKGPFDMLPFKGPFDTLPSGEAKEGNFTVVPKSTL